MVPIIFLLDRTDLQNLEKEQQRKTKGGDRNKRARFNEVVNISEKFGKVQSWFFEKIHKTDKPVARQVKEKKGQITNNQDEKGDIATQPTDIKTLMSIL